MKTTEITMLKKADKRNRPIVFKVSANEESRLRELMGKSKSDSLSHLIRKAIFGGQNE